MSDFYSSQELEQLAQRGVRVLLPEQTAIRRDVDLQQLESGAVLHPGTRLQGQSTRVLAGAEIGPGGYVVLEDSVVGPGAIVGAQGPVSLRQSWVGPQTILGMGVAEEAVFLGREHSGAPPTTGVGFRVRKGSLYEEGACSGQHTDTKMTLLMPWVTLGSNINFCDALLAGGTGDPPGQFSEVGSGTIHFNFTIRGDKATASLLGNVCEGVFLRSERLFIGGNCSLLGPLLAEFGTFSAAGARLSGQLASGLNLGTAHLSGHKNYDPRCFPNLRWIVSTQLQFFGELVALFHWYDQVRVRMAGDAFQESLYRQGQYIVQRNLEERLAQLQLLTELVAENQSHSERVLPETKLKDQRAWLQNWTRKKEQLQSYASTPRLAPESLLRELMDTEGTYTRRIQQLSPVTAEAGQRWLEGIAKPFCEGGLG